MYRGSYRSSVHEWLLPTTLPLSSPPMASTTPAVSNPSTAGSCRGSNSLRSRRRILRSVSGPTDRPEAAVGRCPVRPCWVWHGSCAHVILIDEPGRAICSRPGAGERSSTPRPRAGRPLTQVTPDTVHGDPQDRCVELLKLGQLLVDAIPNDRPGEDEHTQAGR